MKPQKPPKLIEIDPWLEPHEAAIRARGEYMDDYRARMLGSASNVSDYANGAVYYGLHRTGEGWVLREKAPAAAAIHLIGDFNGWNRESHPLTRLPGGDWEIALKGEGALRDGQRLLMQVSSDGRVADRIPAYIASVRQDEASGQFAGVVRAGPEYAWRAESPARLPAPLYIYECHVGMAQERPGTGSYREFVDLILPRIAQSGYNAIQMMAVMEHAYYASFGYQVTNFFAASAWYGPGDDLKYLIDRAHHIGLVVLMDLVHAHASNNARDGVADLDLSGSFYCDGGHPQWGTGLFDYGRPETVHFLLSNIAWWMREYRFDGFRFDGVTSMLYRDHAMGVAFTGYGDYFTENVNLDALAYLRLASELIHELNPRAVAIAEDMSGMPGLCVPVKRGGIGFDYRLNMGVPDFWIKTLKERRDEDWDMHALWHELTTRRPMERTVGYAESHDQALVGDKTIIFRLMDAEMYTGMDKNYYSLAVDRGIALSKLIRFITFALASDAYLNFMGNEFGHPEWVDFPREGNGWSYHYARRQWSLRDNGHLKYEWLAEFDRAMLALGKKHKELLVSPARPLAIDQEEKVIAFEKAGLVFLFNLHPARSREGYRIGGLAPGEYKVCFETDAEAFGGAGRVSREANYDVSGGELVIYAPCRCAMVLKRGEI